MAQPKPTITPEPRERNQVRVKLLEDGSVQNRKTERYILFLVDGVQRADAWRMAFPGTKFTNATYRRRMEDDGTFKARLAALQKENEELDTQAPWGPLLAQARMAYRHAVAKDDLAAMMRATEMAVKLTERMAGGIPQAPGSGDGPGPGRPATEAPKTVRNPEHIRAELLRRGRDMKAVNAQG